MPTFKELSLIRCSITIQSHTDKVLLLVLLGEAQPNAQWDLRTHNAMAAEEVFGVHVHGAAFAMHIAIDAPFNFKLKLIFCILLQVNSPRICSALMPISQAQP